MKNEHPAMNIEAFMGAFTNEEKDELASIALVYAATAMKFVGDLDHGKGLGAIPEKATELCISSEAALSYVGETILSRRDRSVVHALLREAERISDEMDEKVKRIPSESDLGAGAMSGHACGRKRNKKGNFVKSGDFQW